MVPYQSCDCFARDVVLIRDKPWRFKSNGKGRVESIENWVVNLASAPPRTPAFAFAALLGALLLIFLLVARTYSVKHSLGPEAAAAIYLSFGLLLGLALAPAFFSVRFRMMGLLCCAPYVVYGIGTRDFHVLALLRLAAVPLFLIALYAWRAPKDLNRFCWQDCLAAILLISVVLSGFLRDIWRIPVNLDFMSRLFLIGVAAWTWTTVRPVPELGYKLRLSAKILREAALNFLYFAVIAIPLSLWLHFTRWNPRFSGLLAFGGNYIQIFIFIALLEELFFRGFLQSLLAASWRNWRWAQLAVSCLFGLFHILHAPFPNWRYVVLASIAGWFYGSAFRKTGSITASALVHAAVDTTWRIWLSAR